MTTYGELTTEAEQEAQLREASDTTEMLLGTRPSRESEAACWDLLAKRGWYIQKRGWPDFLCSGQTSDFRQIVFCVEVKRHPEDLPRKDQLDMMRTLELSGIACFIWDRHIGFRRVGSFGPDETAIGKQPRDIECPDPSILRCVWCEGGGKEWVSNPATPRDEIVFAVCGHCKGSGLAVPKLESVG